jgi:hypothetical protein
MKALMYAVAAQCLEADVVTWNCGEACVTGVKEVIPVRYTSASERSFGYVTYNSQFNQVVVAFRGSKTFKNWVTNFKTKKIPY